MVTGVTLLLLAGSVSSCSFPKNVKEVDFSMFGIGMEVEFYEPVVGPADMTLRDRE
tara:strand:+ start:1005 stop:1172 length:168 start_codon:yes stop_codon:yes gene_type:complete